jgi:hypothetical protein
MRSSHAFRVLGKVTLTTMVVGLLAAAPALGADVTAPFAGKAVNGGTVVHEFVDGKHVLRVSEDFNIPGSPDPHWQVVDSKGQTYLLNRLTLKDDKVNRSITLPAYIRDVAKVQMWCAWAEVVLGEASFAAPVMAHLDHK